MRNRSILALMLCAVSAAAALGQDGFVPGRHIPNGEWEPAGPATKIEHPLAPPADRHQEQSDSPSDCHTTRAPATADTDTTSSQGQTGDFISNEGGTDLRPASFGITSQIDPGGTLDRQPALERIWFSADYLLWWLRTATSPPLVVTGSANDPFPGALDQPGTRILLGRNGISYDEFNGLRLSGGIWLDDQGVLGVQASGFFLERQTTSFIAQGDANGQPFLAAPFVNATTGNDNVYFISQNFADPNMTALLTGGVRSSSSLRLAGWELNGVANLVRTGGWSADLLAGFREVSLDEDFNYATAASNLAAGGAASFMGTPLDPGFTVATLDRFRTENDFYGGQIGARFDRSWGWCTLDTVAKLAIGATCQRASVDGRTVTDAPLPVQEAAGGIYAQPTNIGSYRRDVFAVVPELAINLYIDLTENVRVGLGYSFLYMSRIARPADQIDSRLNPNQVPIDPGFGTPGGPDRPSFQMKSTDFWAQGLNCSLEIRF